MLRVLLFGCLIALLGIIIAISPFGAGLEERFGLDTLFTLRGERPAPTSVVLVSIDRDAANAIGIPGQLDRWSRIHHARLIETLKALGAETIVFDILFSEQRNKDGDAAMATAMSEADNVALLYMLTSEQQSVRSAKGAHVGAMTSEQRLYPLEIFSDAALATSPFVLPKVPAQVRRFWTFKTESSSTLPVTALQIYGLQIYDAWRSLWQQVDADVAAGFPPDADTSENRKRVLAMGGTLRRMMKDDPSLAIRLRDAVERRAATDREKRILMALLDAYAGDAGRILNFYGGPGSVRTISYHHILDGSSTAGVDAGLAGKAVFVGFSERRIQAQRDGFLTVFSQADGRDLAGVEIAATAFSNLLNGDGILPVPPPAYWVLILLWGLVVGLAFRLLSPMRALQAGFALVSVYFAVAYYGFAAHNLWIPFVVPLFFQAPAAFLLALAWRYRDSSRQRARLKEAFSYYVPSEVVRRYSDEGGALEAGGRLMFGTCLFSDAAQYTRMAECMEPSELGQLVNDYYATLFAPVRSEHGIISDVVGDAMLALWAAEQAGADLSTHACKAALAIARDTARGAKEGRPHGLPTRIGLHAGPILLGNVGAGDHYEYRAVGDTVNTATRIEGLNKLLGTRVLATETVVKDARDHLFRPVGRFVLAGKSRALSVYELLCPELDADVVRDDYLRRYNEGVAAFAAGDWKHASKLFSELLHEQPHDGPSRYYQLLSDEFGRQPPQGWDGIIRLENK